MVLAEMVAGGILAYGVMVAQFGWKMTPPRSEFWAACLGAAVMLAWRLRRAGFHRSLRMAWFSGAGAGFGFAAGNFLQTAGTATGAAFNWWNLMEFTLGFCAGIGLAWGLFSNRWPEAVPTGVGARRVSLAVLLLGFPLVDFIQAFEASRLIEQAERMGAAQPKRLADLQTMAGGLVLLLMAAALVRLRLPGLHSRSGALWLFWSSLIGFVLLSHVRKGVFWLGLGGQSDQAVYWLLVVALVALPAVIPETELESWTGACLRWRSGPPSWFWWF